MPLVKSGTNLTPSLLDRLLDDDPKTASEPNEKTRWNLSMITESVRQDLEALLNTRIETSRELPPEFAETKKSLLTYGLPDLTSFQLKNDQDKRRLTKIIENLVNTFEPRLQRVRVTLKSVDKYHSAIYFKIEAILNVNPVSEQVVFDTALELVSGEYKVEGSN